MSLAYVIGDIHGCYHTLVSAIEQINAIREEEDYIIFLGDYFDRGNFNAEVYHFLRKIEADENYPNVVFLRGNHEQMQLDAINSRNKVMLWFYNGGNVTSDDFTEAQISPTQVKDWIEKMPHAYYNDELDFYCVHSHLPHCHIEDFDEEELKDCIWLRKPSEVGKRVFHGHTPHNFTLVRNNDINLDTGCVFGGGLSYAMVSKNCFGITTVPTHELDKVNLR